MIADHLSAMPLLGYLLTKYIVVFVYLLFMWVYRWWFAPPESRRLLLFATAVGAVVIAAVFSIESARWLRFGFQVVK
jgi:hypothetical protein